MGAGATDTNEGHRARWLLDLGRALAAQPSAPRAMSAAITAVIVFVAMVPFAGWTLPTGWLAFMLALAAAEPRWRGGRPPGEAKDSWRDVNPFAWLGAAGYSAAALYLAYFHGGAAQTLGVTLYGVVMFQILARDYDAPRRLFANLAAPLAAIVVVQAAAAVLLIQRGLPWQILTLLASPYVVYRVFRMVQHNLVRSRSQERCALERLGESEARYRLLAERSPDIIIRYDLHGRLEYLSPAARAFVADPAALVGRNIREFLDPSELERSTAFLEALQQGGPVGQPDQAIWRTWTPDGALLILEGATSPIADDQGRFVGAVAVLRDVTARVALEEELRRKTAEAEAAAVAKSQFLANMSHEIRTPLTGVIGFAGLLGIMEGLPQDARRYVGRIETSAKALLGVVNDVLDFSKLEASQVELDPRPMELRAFVEETADLVRDQAAGKGFSVAVDISDDLPAWIDADAARLRQVLLNLLTNAVKFTDAGEVRIEVEMSDGRLRFAVRDSGVGVPPEDAGRLFQRFSQVDGSNSRRHGGAGLGLAICKGLVEMMGGEIGMESIPGLGSTFWFTIAAQAAQPAPQVPTAAVGAVEGVALRVLMVDDVAVNRELVRAMLEPFDVQVVEAASGAAAVEAAAQTRFDVILMDLQMPGMDGLAAAEAIRAGGSLNRTTPILALSANVLTSDVEACLAAGMSDHIGKPINPAELLGKISKWTEQRKAA